MCACECLCVSVSTRSRGESTWDEGHMQLNTHLVMKQSLGRGFSQNLPQTCAAGGNRGENYFSEQTANKNT